MSQLPFAKKNSSKMPLMMTAETSRARYHRLVAGAFIADMLAVATALLLAQWIRFETPISGFGVPVEDDFRAVDYIGHILLGVALMMVTVTNFRLYARENMLSYTNTLRIIFKSALVWILTYLALTLMLKFDPAISRVFCAIGLVTTMVILPIWRGLLWRVISRNENASSLRQRALVVGWSKGFSRAVKTFTDAPDRPFDIVGVISPPEGDFQEDVPAHMPVMGSYNSLEALLQLRVCQMVIVADDALKTGTLMRIASLCEKEMIEFKLVPTCFQVLLSGLHLESVGGIPILGISRLPLHSTVNRYIKRFVDIMGGLFGLFLAAPVIALFGVLIYRESPGPIFYIQRRLGANGSLFDMVKLRSMKLDAETKGVGWTVKDDPRCLKVGAFMRRWNIDEIPQFWNVLKGDMSLVGPRPECPELIEQFKEEIPHYNARHNIKPGITGWAQVNGLRGDTDLSERVRFDLHYIENWNVILDFQIMLLTFFKREGAC
jgi:exopolysaccharide biosynthesis polyprenyl glycosylphosphotransferase